MSNHLTPYLENVTVADLTQRQAKFVQAYIECGTQRDGAIQAALAAGYGNGDRKQAKSRSYELLHDPRILAVLRNEISKTFGAAAAIGTGVLIELAQTARSEQVRLGAARELVDRGYGPIMSCNAVPPDDTKQRELEEFYANLKAINDRDIEREAHADGEEIYDMSRRLPVVGTEAQE